MREGVTHLVNFAFAKSLYLLGAAPLPLLTELPRAFHSRKLGFRYQVF
jgi:hypothetical protein